mgnify:CR=1 FL=1
MLFRSHNVDISEASHQCESVNEQSGHCAEWNSCYNHLQCICEASLRYGLGYGGEGPICGWMTRATCHYIRLSQLPEVIITLPQLFHVQHNGKSSFGAMTASYVSRWSILTGRKKCTARWILVRDLQHARGQSINPNIWAAERWEFEKEKTRAIMKEYQGRTSKANERITYSVGIWIYPTAMEGFLMKTPACSMGRRIYLVV